MGAPWVAYSIIPPHRSFVPQEHPVFNPHYTTLIMFKVG